MASEYEISTDPRLLDIALIHDYLACSSYWAQGRSRAEVEKSIAHSLCFGVYQARTCRTCGCLPCVRATRTACMRSTALARCRSLKR